MGARCVIVTNGYTPAMAYTRGRTSAQRQAAHTQRRKALAKSAGDFYEISSFVYMALRDGASKQERAAARNELDRARNQYREAQSVAVTDAR